MSDLPTKAYNEALSVLHGLAGPGEAWLHWCDEATRQTADAVLAVVAEHVEARQSAAQRSVDSLEGTESLVLLGMARAELGLCRSLLSDLRPTPEEEK